MGDVYRSSSALPAKPYIGGQAVIEGVMMRAPSSLATVVRRKDGSLHVRERAIVSDRTGWRGLPFLRGINSLVESLRLGGDALRFSAEQYEKDLDLAEVAAAKGKAAGTNVLSALTLVLMALFAGDAEGVSAGDKKSNGSAMTFMLVVMVAFLWALPQGAAAIVNRGLHLNLEVQSPMFQALTGAFKLVIVLGYLLLIRRVSDIRRVFQYHGAEHKTISTYEAEEELTVENARRKTTLHPRCGTTFLVMVVLMSIAVFTVLGGFLPKINTGNAAFDNGLFFLAKLPFIPVIAGLTFELQRLFARYCTTGPLRALLWPGFMVQKITTIEPDDAQLEVALASLRATLFRENGEADSSTDDVRFTDYTAISTASRLRAA